MFDESLHKVNKYYDALSVKKQQRNDIITNERSGGLNFMKIGSQSSRNPAELVNQKAEDRAKNAVLNKRVRSSVAEIRVCSLDFLQVHSLFSCYVVNLTDLLLAQYHL